jgi:hypothetical protein
MYMCFSGTGSSFYITNNNECIGGTRDFSARTHQKFIIQEFVRSAVGAVPVPSSHDIVITNWVEFATSKTCAPESTVFTTNSV